MLEDVLLEEVSLMEVMNKLGYQTNRDRIVCPFHDDTDPSMGIDWHNNKFNCLGCGAHGNQLSFFNHHFNKINGHFLKKDKVVTLMSKMFQVFEVKIKRTFDVLRLMPKYNERFHREDEKEVDVIAKIIKIQTGIDYGTTVTEEYSLDSLMGGEDFCLEN